MFGLDVSKESIPKNVHEQVLLLWNDGAYRQALGVLYRATLSGLMHDYHFTFSESKTESECAEIVKRSGEMDLSTYVTALTIRWQQLAYGHKVPEDLVVKQLCADWRGLFLQKNNGEAPS
jgi:hypothetical protein